MTNRFKGLDLVDRVPGELRTEVHNIVQKAEAKTIPKKKKLKKAKWLSEEALQIAEKRRAAKGKGAKERYTHLNAEFQRIARRDKKAFLGDQCKEIEENNRMGKTRELLAKLLAFAVLHLYSKAKLACNFRYLLTSYFFYNVKNQTGCLRKPNK